MSCIICYLTTISLASSQAVPACERKIEREPGKIYHVWNVTVRDNLHVITCGRMNELAHTLLTDYTCSVVCCESLMADRMGLNGTVLHYLGVW